MRSRSEGCVEKGGEGNDFKTGVGGTNERTKRGEGLLAWRNAKAGKKISKRGHG